MSSKVAYLPHPGLFYKLIAADPSVSWPPPDPDRIPSFEPDQAFTFQSASSSNEDAVEAFRKRQSADIKRYEFTAYRRRPFHDRHRELDSQQTNAPLPAPTPHAGEEAWRNSEGDRLNDFGVDEDVEFYDEEDVPLAQLIRGRQAG